MKITKPKPMLPELPQLFTSLTPPPLRPIPYNGGLLTRMFEKMRLEDIAQMQELHAKIAESQRQQTQSMAMGMMEAITFGARLRATLETFEHERSSREHARVMFKREEEMTEAEIKKANAEAKSAEFEAGITELDYRMRVREFNMILKMDKEEQNED